MRLYNQVFKMARIYAIIVDEINKNQLNRAKIKISVILMLLVFASVDFAVSMPVSYAASGDQVIGQTVLPYGDESQLTCVESMAYTDSALEGYVAKDREGANRILGCAIKTGKIRLWMVPYFIRYLLEFVLQLAGLIAVGGMVYGGFLYLFAGLTEAKDQGKKALKYSIMGFVLTMTAWALVNILISLLTM
jgi:hypothetical protein